jgi:glutathione S-transferase
MARVAAVGHGRPLPLSPADALGIAARATPAPLRPGVSDDAYPAPGTDVEITPDGYRNEPIAGTLCRVDAWDLAIRRSDPRLGELVVHFPRIGYTVRAARGAGAS